MVEPLDTVLVGSRHRSPIVASAIDALEHELEVAMPSGFLMLGIGDGAPVLRHEASR